MEVSTSTGGAIPYGRTRQMRSWFLSRRSLREKDLDRARGRDISHIVRFYYDTFVRLGVQNHM